MVLSSEDIMTSTSVSPQAPNSNVSAVTAECVEMRYHCGANNHSFNTSPPSPRYGSTNYYSNNNNNVFMCDASADLSLAMGGGGNGVNGGGAETDPVEVAQRTITELGALNDESYLTASMDATPGVHPGGGVEGNADYGEEFYGNLPIAVSVSSSSPSCNSNTTLLYPSNPTQCAPPPSDDILARTLDITFNNNNMADLGADHGNDPGLGEVGYRRQMALEVADDPTYIDHPITIVSNDYYNHNDTHM